MRPSGRLFLLALLLVPSLAAKATSIPPPKGYKSNILDPPTPPVITTSFIGSSPFSFSFSQCTLPELPGNSSINQNGTVTLPDGETADGCFPAINRTGSSITSFQYTVPNSGGVAGLTASCDLDPGDALFSTGTCTDPTTSLNQFTLSFTGDGIPANEYFVIVESGVPFADFPTANASFTTSASVTPEPSPALLLATGLLCMGCLRWSLRRA